MTDDILRIEDLTSELNALTVGEIEDLEEITEGPLDVSFSEGSKKGKALKALAWVLKRREDESFTLEDARKMRVQLEETKPEEESPDPKG